MCIKSLFRKGYDNLKFTALEVRYGDAFLLQKDGRNCLFDAGQYNDIINALANNNVEKIDLAICSHNDVDHADGFVKLFEKKFPITEIWLPGFWASILQFVINNWNNKTIWFNVSRYADLDKNKSKESLKEIDPNTLYNGESEPVDKFHHELNDFVKTHEVINNIPWLDSKTAKSIKLNKILEIAEKACNNDCDIHWFEPFNGCTDFKNQLHTTFFL